MKAAHKVRFALFPVLLLLAAFSARAADVKAPAVPAVIPSGAMPVAPALPGPADLGAGAAPEGLPVLPSGSEIPGLPASAISNPGVLPPAAPALVAPLLPQGAAPQAQVPAAIGPKAAGAAVLAPEAPQAPAVSGALSPAPSAKEALSQITDKVVPASVADASAGNAGFSSAFDGRGPGSGDGAAPKGGPTYRVQTHDGVPHLHAYHPEDDDASFPADDQGNPFIVPDHLKPLLPSAQDKAHWTGRITLHLHSVFSDGTLEPEELVQLAYDKGVRNLSLTEHDTTASTVRAWRKARELGMDYHPGAELTARGGVHIGAMDINIHNPKLVALLATVRAMRYRRAEAIVRHLNENPEIRRRGITITLAEVVAHSRHDQGGTIELPHIARVLVDKGLIKSVDEAFDTYLKGDIAGDSSPENRDPDVDTVLDAIHSAEGKAIFNHPYTVDGRSDADKDAKALAIVQKGMDGIEVYRPSHATSENGKRRADERVAKYLGWVDRFNLFAAPGADFHGTDTHLNTLVVWMPKNLAAQLKDRLKDSNARALAALEKGEKTPSGAASLLGFLPPALWSASEGDHASLFSQWRWLAGMAFVASMVAVVVLGAGLVDKLYESAWGKRRPRLANLVYGASLLALPAVLFLLALIWLHWVGGL